jgi:hypothetical protein
MTTDEKSGQPRHRLLGTHAAYHSSTGKSPLEVP